jgi:hypothetical protein
MKNNLKPADFEKFEGQKFSLRFGTGTDADAVLKEVLTSSPQTFSLLFKLSQPADAPQGICKIHHEKLGDMEIFLVPVGPDEYEAVFNFIPEQNDQDTAG